MNRAKIKQIINTPGLNFYQSYQDNQRRHFAFFDPYNSECVEFDGYFHRKNNHYEIHINNVREMVDSVDWQPHHQNYIKKFRSFILATIIAGMKRHNGARLILCKSESAARNYSNLGGVVVCIINPLGSKQWSVVK